MTPTQKAAAQRVAGIHIMTLTQKKALLRLEQIHRRRSELEDELDALDDELTALDPVAYPRAYGPLTQAQTIVRTSFEELERRVFAPSSESEITGLFENDS